MKFNIPSIDLPREIRAALNERLTFYNYFLVMSRPFRREMPTRLYRDACILRHAGFAEWECEVVIRARCDGFIRYIVDKEFINAVREASEFCAPKTEQPVKSLEFPPIQKDAA